MAVPEGERRPCKMDVFMHELDLVTYTLQITRNYGLRGCDCQIRYSLA